MNSYKHLPGDWLELVKTERKGIAPGEIPEVSPLGVTDINLAGSFFMKLQEHLLQGEGNGLVP